MKSYFIEKKNIIKSLMEDGKIFEPTIVTYRERLAGLSNNPNTLSILIVPLYSAIKYVTKNKPKTYLKQFTENKNNLDCLDILHVLQVIMIDNEYNIQLTDEKMMTYNKLLSNIEKIFNNLDKFIKDNPYADFNYTDDIETDYSDVYDLTSELTYLIGLLIED